MQDTEIKKILNTMSLVKERNQWRTDMVCGRWKDPYILKEYRKNRNSETWRTSNQIERILEYVLHLEDLLEAINKEIK